MPAFSAMDKESSILYGKLIEAIEKKGKNPSEKKYKDAYKEALNDCLTWIKHLRDDNAPFSYYWLQGDMDRLIKKYKTSNPHLPGYTRAYESGINSVKSIIHGIRISQNG